MNIIKPINNHQHILDGCFVDPDMKFIFIHIYRNSSISFRNAMGMRKRYFNFFEVNDNKKIKVIILRNPVTRLVSCYQYLLRLENNGFPEQYPTHLTEQTLFYQNRNNVIKSFNQFIEAIDDKNFYDATLRPQVQFIEDKELTIDKIEVVMLQETIDIDFSVFIKKYNLNISFFPHDNKCNDDIKNQLLKYIESNKTISSKIYELYEKDFLLYESIK